MDEIAHPTKNSPYRKTPDDCPASASTSTLSEERHQKRITQPVHYRSFTQTALRHFVALLAGSVKLIGGSPLFESDYDVAMRRARHRSRGTTNNTVIAQDSQNVRQTEVVHTFGTLDSCSRNCAYACIAQELEDMAMMQRWICTAKAQHMNNSPSFRSDVVNSRISSGSNFIYSSNPNHTAEIFPFNSQLLLIIVPLGILTLILIFIIWCRKCSKTTL